MIAHSQPTVGIDEAKAAFYEIKEGALGGGSKISKLEANMRKYVDRNYAKCTSSGTTAIQLALRSLGVGDGDEVVIPSYVCYSVMSAVNSTGAKPVFADILEKSPNIGRETIENKITDNTKCAIVPHMFGIKADVKGIRELGLFVVEDCAQAIGGESIGSLGDASILSFYATKILACARGGMVLTDNPEFYEKLEDLMQYDAREKPGECYNFSMTNIEAAIGLVQLEKLDLFVRSRGFIGTIYDELLKEKNLSEMVLKRPSGSIVGRYVVSLPDNQNLDEVIEKMHSEGVDCRKPVFRPLHTYFDSGDYPNTSYAYSRYLSLPVYPGLRVEEAEYVGEKLVKIIKR